MTRKNPLDEMSDAEIEEYLQSRKSGKINELRQAFEAIATEKFGEDWENHTNLRLVTLEELRGKGGSKLKGRTVPVKYRDSEGNEWSGRGVPPKVWGFLYKDGKPLPREKVEALLDQKGFKIDKPKGKGKGPVSSESTFSAKA